LIKNNDLETSIRDFCYSNFGWIGKKLAKIFKTIDKDLESAYLKIHPEVYFSLVGFLSLLSLLIPVILIITYVTGMWRSIPSLPLNGLILFPITLVIPIIIIALSVIIPKTFASNRMSNLQIEIPYASMYVSVMVSGGLSPFESFKRMGNMDLLPNMQKEVSRLETIVMSTGVDPITAMEQAAKAIDLKDYNELLLGYASSVRTGGDTMHYLFNQTQGMFRRLTTTVKSKGETAAMLMEAYTIVGILGVLGIFLMFVVGLSLPTAGMSLSPSQFFLFSFVVMPFLSFLFIYASDAIQFNYPISNWKPYYVLLGVLPIGGFLASQMVLPSFSEEFLIVPPLYDLVLWISKRLSFAEGTESALGLTICLIFVAIPVFVSDYLSAGKDSSLQDGISQFLRDLVEVRKSGLGPEKSIEALTNREYKGFSRHLIDISTKINWGYPLRQIYIEFADKVKNWLGLVNIYLLIDTLEVGGGTEESIESLAKFSEATKDLEAEKRAILMPLMIVPYIGAALLTGTTVLFLSFFANSNLGVSIPTKMLFRTLLTPIALHCFSLGLVTGKLTSGRVSSGFKHSIFLSLVALGGIWVVSNMDLGGGLI
jgi:flagellar protein FlaJ